MRNRFGKEIFKYLLEIVTDGSNEPTARIIEDLSRHTCSASVQFQLCESAVKKLKGYAYLPPKDVERVIVFICETAKKVAIYDKEVSASILNLLLTDSILERSYSGIAESIVSILDDRAASENVLKKVFDILKQKIQGRSKQTIISENSVVEISKYEFFTCSTVDFVRLAYVWIDIGGNKSFAKEIVDYGSQYAQGFYECLELCEFYIRCVEARDTAIRYLRRAERLAGDSDFDEHWALCHNLFLLVKDEEWSHQIFDKCRNLARTAEDFTRLGEITGNKNGLPDMELCREMFAIAMQRATNDEEKRCVQDSIENVMEEYEQD